MIRMFASQARAGLRRVLTGLVRVRRPVVLTRRGKPVVALISIEDLHLFRRLVEDEEDRIDIASARRILADPTEVPIPWEQVKARNHAMNVS